MDKRRTLSTLDANQISAIPQPSARKPSRPSNIPATLYSAGQNAKHHRRQSSYGEGRLSYAPGNSIGHGSQPLPSQSTAGASAGNMTVMSTGRRSSIYSGNRHSSMGGGGSVGVLSQSTSQAPSKDPRPVREKGFKEACMQRIIDYLGRTHYNGNPTIKTLSTPTQKEFVSIFHHLYHQFDPNFQFIKKIDEDVLYCIKTLRYPFADAIPRSQLSAVGSPHSWPNLLAMLNWMVESLEMLGEVFSPEGQMKVDQSTNPDKIYFNHYLTKAYQRFLLGDDEFGVAEKALEEESDRQNETMLAEIERLGDENERTEKALQEIRDSQPPLRDLEKMREDTVHDCAKFRAHIGKLVGKCEKLTFVNDRLRTQARTTEVELEQLARLRVELQAQVDAQNISAADVEKMNSNHESLIKSLDTATQQSEEASARLLEHEREAQTKLDGLERAIQTYNTLGYKIGVIPASAPNAKGVDFELEYVDPVEQNRTWLATRPEHLIRTNLRHEVKPALAKLREELGTRGHQLVDEHDRLGEKADEASEALGDKKEELEALDAKLIATIEQFDEVRVTTAAETSAANATAEQMERDLSTARISAQNGLLQVEQRLQAVSIEHEQLQHAYAINHEAITRDVVKALDEVIQFRLHIASSLETLADEADNVEVETDTLGAAE